MGIIKSVLDWFQLVYDTIQYIRLNGWAEYRKARERYDKHQEALKNRSYKYSKVGEIKMRNEIAKKKRK